MLWIPKILEYRPLVSEITEPVKRPVCQDEPDVITELGYSMIDDGLLFCNLFVP